MSTLKVKREKSFISSVRDFKVILDGEVIGDVSNGAEQIFEVSEGSHTIQSGISLINGMSKKLSINVKGDESEVVVKPNPIMWVLLLICVITGVSLGLSASHGSFSIIPVIIFIVAFALALFFGVQIKQVK